MITALALACALGRTAAAADLEAAALDALRGHRWNEAVRVLGVWRAEKPADPYVLRLLARAEESRRTPADAVGVYAALAEADPSDRKVRARLEELLAAEPGLFWRFSDAKSIAPEGLETAAPQRIVYEGRSASLRARVRGPVETRFLAGAEVKQLSQRNLTGGFSYYDVLEQVYSVGAEARPFESLGLTGEYGQSLFSDIHGDAIGTPSFSRVKGAADWTAGGAQVRLAGERAPFLLRDFGGSRFFSLLRRSAGDLSVSGWLGGWDMLGGTGVEAFSERTTLYRGRARASRDTPAGVFTTSYAHDFQDAYGAIGGRYRPVAFDRWGQGWSLERRLGRAEAYYGYALYHDANRRHDALAAVESAPELARGFSARYEASVWRFRSQSVDYRSGDEQAHWIGPFWTLCSRKWSVRTGGQHAWARDLRGAWEANRGSLSAAWRPKPEASIEAAADGLRSTVGDQAFRVSLSGRWSF